MRSTKNTSQGSQLQFCMNFTTSVFYSVCIIHTNGCFHNTSRSHGPNIWTHVFSFDERPWIMLPDKSFLLDSDHQGFQLLKLEAHDLGPCWNNSTCSLTLKLFLSARKHRGLSIVNFKLTDNTVELCKRPSKMSSLGGRLWELKPYWVKILPYYHMVIVRPGAHR